MSGHKAVISAPAFHVAWKTRLFAYLWSVETQSNCSFKKRYKVGCDRILTYELQRISSPTSRTQTSEECYVRCHLNQLMYAYVRAGHGVCSRAAVGCHGLTG